jgi:hypothetical protein
MEKAAKHSTAILYKSCSGFFVLDIDFKFILKKETNYFENNRSILLLQCELFESIGVGRNFQQAKRSLLDTIEKFLMRLSNQKDLYEFLKRKKFKVISSKKDLEQITIKVRDCSL